MSEVRCEVLLEGDSRLCLWPDAFAAEADGWLQQLDAGIPWRQERIRVYGRSHPIPRRQAWFGDPGCCYRYSGLLLQPQPWTPLLADIRHHVAALAGSDFNAVLLNRYANGADHMGWHSDDEPELGDAPPIAILSLGAERPLALRRKGAGESFRVALPHDSLLLMAGRFQHDWQHALPVRRRIHELRLSLTFRCIQRAV